MTRAVRALDALAAVLALVVLAVLATGGARIGGIPVTRAEDVTVVLALVVGLRAWLRPWSVPRVPPRWAVAAGALVYAIAMGFVVVSRHVGLRTHALDLGYYAQVVWSIADGRGAWVSLPPMHAWGDHFSPVLYLLAPLGRLGDVSTALLVAQTVIFAAGAFAVFGFAARHLGDARLAAGFALLYLLNPSLHGINVRDVHPAAFAIPLVIAGALAFDARRYVWCAAALALMLAGREDAAVAGAGFAIWLAVARRRWALGAAVAVACVAGLWMDMTWVMPYFRGAPYPHLGRYAHLGHSLPEILVSIFFRPWRWLVVVVTPAKILYVLALLAPLGFLPLLAPRALAAVVPGLAMNLMSTDSVLFHHRTQYQAYVLPFLVLAAVEGARVLAAARDGADGGWRRRLPVLPRVLAAAFVVSVVLSARTMNELMVTRWRLGPEQRAAHQLMARLAAGVTVSVNERLVPHLATRAEVFIFPQALDRSAYVLDRATEIDKRPPPGWVEVERAGGWLLLRRAQAAEQGPSASLAPSAARSTYREYASRAAVGRRLASGPF